ncbi:hypothetical protein J5N97_004686 [Dioscorea zingiberensis]|uniref:FAD-binding PCMH-type domain-containing protein n=1 Tax=Dioscorea zingiberensis TaxID=325984 RepID=A0A9D5D6N4_9LILI|nr:hypothetical protein J5N97_004686 [Dioscorea zingiberensis]
MAAIIFTLVFILFHSSLHFALSENTTQGAGLLQCLERFSPPCTNLSEHLYFPNSSNFSSLLLSSIQNLRYTSAATPKPALIIIPSSEFEVQAAVHCCKRNGLRLRVRSGGHDYEGLSYHSFNKDPFVLLDLANLRSVDVDVEEGTAWVQAGATTGDLYYRIGEKTSTYGFPAGTCSTLGTGGHFSGGGMGTMNPRAAYLNFRDLDLGRNEDEETSFLDAWVWGKKYFKGNFWKLAMVKGDADPDNFFKSEQSIPPPPLMNWI